MKKLTKAQKARKEKRRQELNDKKTVKNCFKYGRGIGRK